MDRTQITYEPSIYDDLYYDLTGSYLTKEGTAYEKISTAIIGLLQDKGVAHDMRIRGKSGSIYQIDGLVDKIIMVEAKDYAKRNSKVSRGDLQKQEGALTDLEGITEGYFASATDFTIPARKYAKGTAVNEMQKEIKAFDIRKSSEDDKKGRIQVINVKMVARWPEYRPDGFRIIWYDKATEAAFLQHSLNVDPADRGFQIHVFYDGQGNVIDTIENVSKTQSPKYLDTDTEVYGTFNIDAYVSAAGKLFHIKGITYIADIITELNDFEVKKEGDALMLAKCDDLDINTLITDVELKLALLKLN